VAPTGISTHNVLVAEDDKVAVTLINQRHGFSPERLSLTFEKQMDPDVDIVPHNAAYRGFRSELGSLPVNLRLIAVAAEKATAYTSWCFVGKTPETEQAVVESWKNAKERDEALWLLMIPVQEIRHVLTEEVKPSTIREFIRGGTLPDTTINLHPTAL